MNTSVTPMSRRRLHTPATDSRAALFGLVTLISGIAWTLWVLAVVGGP